MPKNPVKIEDCDLPNVVAELAGIANQRVYEAIRDGRIETRTLAGGTVVVPVAEAERLRDEMRPPGRPRKVAAE